MNKIYITSVLGAPSPTAVIFSDEDVKELSWRDVAESTYYFLKEKEVKFSKMAIIYKKSDDSYDFKFVQIKDMDKNLSMESNANCGNSMLASARVIFMLLDDNQKNNVSCITITNVDTKLEILIQRSEDCFNMTVKNLENKNINEFRMYDGSEKCTIKFGEKYINYSMINAINEYILVDAEEIGIHSEEELLALDKSDDTYLPKVKELRKAIIDKHNLNKESEFPKIAVIYNKEQLAARTVYLDSWHKGLPITGSVTIMIATKIKNSIIYNASKENNVIHTPNGDKIVQIDLDNNNRIVACTICGIKTVGDITIFQK